MQDRKGVFIIVSPDVVNWEENWEVKWEKTSKVGEINQKVGKIDLIFPTFIVLYLFFKNLYILYLIKWYFWYIVSDYTTNIIILLKE